MEALVKAAPVAMRFPGKAGTAAAQFPEFRAWHVLVRELFGIQPPEWKKESTLQPILITEHEEEEGEDE